MSIISGLPHGGCNWLGCKDCFPKGAPIHKHEENVKELRNMLKGAEKLLADRQREIAKEVKPVYEFSLVPVFHKMDKVYDPSCKLYQLFGLVLNKKELESVGKTAYEGAMTYLFNTLSSKFVMAVGGGSIFTENPECFAELSSFIINNPAGGNVSIIVNKYRG